MCELVRIWASLFQAELVNKAFGRKSGVVLSRLAIDLRMGRYNEMVIKKSWTNDGTE